MFWPFSVQAGEFQGKHIHCSNTGGIPTSCGLFREQDILLHLLAAVHCAPQFFSWGSVSIMESNMGVCSATEVWKILGKSEGFWYLDLQRRLKVRRLVLFKYSIEYLEIGFSLPSQKKEDVFKFFQLKRHLMVETPPVPKEGANLF